MTLVLEIFICYNSFITVNIEQVRKARLPGVRSRKQSSYQLSHLMCMKMDGNSK